MSRKNIQRISLISRDAAPFRAQTHLYLKAKIMRGGYKPCAGIKERDLMKTLGVSITFIRETIRQVEGHKPITVEQKVGTRVRIMSASEAHEICLMRATIEKLAVSLFKNLFYISLKKLTNSFGQLRASFKESSSELIIKQKNKCFRLIYLHLGNQVLSGLVDSLASQSWRWLSLSLAHSNPDPKRLIF